MRRKCCSIECMNKYRSLFFCGDNNPNYKAIIETENGVKRIDFNRYRNVYQEVTKYYLGIKKMIKGYCVHHKDCDHTNNTPTNLIYIPK